MKWLIHGFPTLEENDCLRDGTTETTTLNGTTSTDTPYFDFVRRSVVGRSLTLGVRLSGVPRVRTVGGTLGPLSRNGSTWNSSDVASTVELTFRHSLGLHVLERFGRVWELGAFDTLLCTPNKIQTPIQQYVGFHWLRCLCSKIKVCHYTLSSSHNFSLSLKIL